MEKMTFTVTENGFHVDGSGKVSCPECKIKAVSFMDAIEKLTKFLKTRQPDPDIELITPMEKIAFE